MCVCVARALLVVLARIRMLLSRCIVAYVVIVALLVHIVIDIAELLCCKCWHCGNGCLSLLTTPHISTDVWQEAGCQSPLSMAEIVP